MSINRVVLTANLTRDPELRASKNGNAITSMRVATNTRRKTSEGVWEEKPNYFDVTVFGAQAENCKKFLAKGRGVAIDGRLEWYDWEAEGGETRQNVQIVAEQIQFLPTSNGNSGKETEMVATAGADEVPF